LKGGITALLLLIRGGLLTSKFRLRRFQFVVQLVGRSLGCAHFVGCGCQCDTGFELGDFLLSKFGFVLGAALRLLVLLGL